MSMGSQTKQIPRKYLIVAYFFVGLLFIIGTPLAFYSYPVINYDDIAVGVIFGLIIILAALWDWRSAKSMKRNIAPYVILLLGLISIFLFSYTYDTPWIGTYHLYIFQIDGGGSSNAFYIPGSAGEYAVQNYLAEISTMGGLITVIAALYEIFGIVRKLPKM
jgi:hypothetical protein